MTNTGKLKQIAIGIGIAIGGVMLLGAILGAISSSNYENMQGEQKPEIKQPLMVTKNIEELIPTREDVGTIWKISSSGEVSIDEHKGLQYQFFKGVPYSSTTVKTSVYKFDSVENLNKYYSNRTITLKQEGGFEEMKLNSRDATCYGTYREGMLLDETATFRCVKENIYVVSTATSTEFEGKIHAEEFARMILQKIN